jgi:hypothetical protein
MEREAEKEKELTKEKEKQARLAAKKVSLFYGRTNIHVV